MLYRFVFPVPSHGEMISVTKYVESDNSPVKKELLRIFEWDRKEAEQKARNLPDNEAAWRDLKNLEGCIYALEHILAPELPKLPANGLNDIPIICETTLSRSVIRVQLIRPTKLNSPRLRAVGGE